MTTLTVKHAGGRPDYYQILGVSHKADFREIGAGYWRLARGAGSEQRVELNAAYETLNDEDRRRAYDAQWAEAGHVEEPRPEPANEPSQAEAPPSRPEDRAEAGRHVEESHREPASEPPQAVRASSEPEPQVNVPAAEPEESLSFTKRLGWPRAM